MQERLQETVSLANNDENSEYHVDQNLDLSAINTDSDNKMNNATCFIEESKTGLSEDQTCNCQKTDSCKKVSFGPASKVNFGGTSFQSLMNSSLNQIKDYGNSVYSGKFNTASIDNASLERNAATLKTFRNKQIEKINQALAKKGKDNFNYQGLQDKWKNRMFLKVKRALASMPESDRSKLLSLTNNNKTQEQKNENTASKEKESNITNTNEAKQISNSSQKANNKDFDPFSNLDFSEDLKMNFISAVKKLKRQNENENKSTESKVQISKSDKSIFEQLTIRYMKTAYPILFLEE